MNHPIKFLFAQNVLLVIKLPVAIEIAAPMVKPVTSMVIVLIVYAADRCIPTARDRSDYLIPIAVDVAELTEGSVEHGTHGSKRLSLLPSAAVELPVAVEDSIVIVEDVSTIIVVLVVHAANGGVTLTVDGPDGLVPVPIEGSRLEERTAECGAH